MCGICGKLSYGNKPIDEKLLEKMCKTLSYRGPDDEGFFCNSNLKTQNSKVHIGLGHRRLSIIDLSDAGHQPMCNEDETIWLVYNGEIYNFKKIRVELETKGHRFRSNTDSEVIIHLYEEEGIDCLKKLNGMFAFCLWDNGLQKLYLCRDRLGIKPLVYYWDGQNLIFASEIKGILSDPDVSKEIDWISLDLYLTFNYIPAPKTIFKNLQKLEPAHYLLAENETVVTKKYWDISTNSEQLRDKLINEGERIAFYKKRLYELIDKSVRRRLISDVPLGAFLSGGVDSSIIVALMARNSVIPVKTFSIGYKDLPLFDETKYARKFTPRKADSVWSESNKKRAAKMIKAGLMTEPGMRKVQAAKRSGRWDKPVQKPELTFAMPPEFREALAKNKAAKENFDKLAPTYRKPFIGWIEIAKRPETREKRIKESIRLLEKGEKLGLK